MMPNNRGRTESDNAARLLQAPAKVDIVASLVIFRIKTADLFEGPAIKRHVTTRDMLGHGIGQQNVARPTGRGRPRVAGVTQAVVALVNITNVRKLRGDLRRVVSRSIIHQDDFAIWIIEFA